MISNSEIIEKNLDLIQTCIDCQFAKLKDPGKKQFKDDIRNDIIIELLEYDPEKMNNAWENKHFNALVTKVIINNIYSTTSRFYNKYLKFDRQTDDIDDYEEQF